MSTNFGMWLTALQRPIKLKEKKEWDALDFITKWLIATRGTVCLCDCGTLGLARWSLFLAALADYDDRPLSGS